MTILENVTDDLLALSKGDLQLYQETTSRFVSALKQDRIERDAAAVPQVRETVGQTMLTR